MFANEILERLKADLENEAKKFPADVRCEVCAYFEDEEGNEKQSFSAEDKTFEAWGVLTVSAGKIPESEEDEDEAVYGFPVAISVAKDGTVSDEEVAEAEAELSQVVGDFVAAMATAQSSEAYIRELNARAEKEYEAELEKFNRSLKNMKKMVICTAIGAVVILVFMVVLKAVLG